MAISVVSNPLSCQTEGVVRISGYMDGLISSAEVHRMRNQNNICPWSLETEPGQHFNVSISRPESESNIIEPCKDIAVIADGEAEHTVCGNGKRDEHVYLSQSNEITISFIENNAVGSYMILFKGNITFSVNV